MATLMCLLGVGIFCGTMYRGASLTIIMLDQVFHLRFIWYDIETNCLELNRIEYLL